MADWYAGIDVSKAQLDVALSGEGEKLWSTSNDAAGITALVECLLSLAPALVVLEATGGFENAATAALVERPLRRSKRCLPVAGRSSG